MHIVYAFENAPEKYTRSIFLAGPTPRDDQTPSWRPQALRILETSGYDGVVFVPEARDGMWRKDYDGQLEWEDKHLNLADCVLFWVPREIKNMPAFTTNDEWGTWKYSGKSVFGAPPNAPKTNYQRYYAKKLLVPSAETLEGTAALALKMLGDGAERSDGEREVPLYIWRTPHFQAWYQAQKNAGNRLDGARVLSVFRVGKKKELIFLFVLHVNIYVKSENRNKTNEVVVSRPDISSILLYHPGKTSAETEVILIKEFRSPAATTDGNVWELPGGSASRPGIEPPENAVEELREETGFTIDPFRFKMHAPRQLAATLSTHKAHLFSARITKEELEWFRREKGVAHGDGEFSERTYVEIKTVREILDSPNPDWTTIGMIMSVIN
ncbi:MAG: hypothetical protein A3C93_03155 [Candidatus Lloydbacteria bacterium RIFCSPHIGHO2_02_FULL_54_17]|uniref:Nudix hydrolase domain-containing protein n=1 Tax=Candidatus Lloydbacteria bacterium RIFCSPHIGHO2_02_FULL_54_17 TaxID=1798664 RepID=A0A1G2DEL4_9BACT|nr:MAG: hypothetical protein A2762_04175 [Candidatus Lloydbacteria bacterium RIFCSPHIGHO2_01_FULL_54_11]OGZ12075.1 MAG: hypothetical protein A3C93_03155 [Candidatus Lloydbacteria bacterium RIFCSPHIGHO2_02_FULL_54_17]OGZ13392.1 MAG: hypothetical protein A2948_01390 [Candidatus Lloydbacteria bacterium RIFCSPLOWO2_01_FULL_54_18]OGZ15755.1 MAG: hypothetical protein A3H76_06475 [Candidatus Lloydbacteria bacterium RIFCSPLOWO2_02_FULL_54_12]